MYQNKKDHAAPYVVLAVIGALLMFTVLPGVLVWSVVHEQNVAYDEGANRDAYETLVEGLKNMDETIEIPGRNMEDVSEVFKRILDREEEVFWVSWSYEYGEYSRFGRTIGYLQPTYVFTKDEVEEMQNELSEIVEAVKEKCADYSAFERALFAHDLICEIAEYDYEAADADNDDPETPDSKEVVLASSAYGALINGKAICGGYSKAYKLLLDALDVPCECVCGESEDELHEWNRIELSGEWYFVDVTWGDMEEYISYNYFAIDSDTLLIDHSFDADEIVKETDASAENYDVHFGFYVPEGAKTAQIAEIIERQIEDGYARIRFESQADLNAMWDYFFVNNHCYDIPIMEDLEDAGYVIYWINHDDRPVIEIYLSVE